MTGNCFAIREGKCTILITAKCEDCKFGKTEEQLQAERDKAKARLKQIRRKGILLKFFER